MTDREIVKALESYIKDIACAKCGFKDNYLLIVIKNALDLINRQKADYDRLQKSYLRNQEIFAEQSLENERLKAENERLQNILICFMDALGKVRKIDDIDEISLIPLMSELNKQYRAELKAEAYKEFAEKAKEFMHNKFKALDEYEFEYITERDIDNLIKEIIGE